MAAGSGTTYECVLSKRVMMLMALLLEFCCLGHGVVDGERRLGVGGISSCIESERRALLAVKSDMYDPGDWFSSWTGKDCCRWRGVACDNTTGHVTKLDLHCPYTYDMEDILYIVETMGTSTVNPSLQELKHLKYLDLSMHNFSGAPVPNVITSLVHLEYLNLSYAMFDGLIPPRPGNLSNLYCLDLQGWYGDLHIDDLEWLSRIPSLKYVDTSDVNLSKATNWLHIISSISALEVLRLSEADLPYVPSPLPPFNLTALTRLDLSWNSNITSTMPRWLSNTTSLEYLDLSHSGSLTIESLQVAPEALLNLKELDLSHNSLRGEVLRILSNVRSRGLMHLDLSWNYLSGDITQALCSLRHLEYLDLAGNIDAIGHIPEILGNLTSLQQLYYWTNTRDNWWTPSLAKLGHVLDLSSNNLFGSIPPSFGSFGTMAEVPEARVQQEVEDDKKLEKLLEYAGTVVGFVVGFWLFTGTLIMKQVIRDAFFRWIDKTDSSTSLGELAAELLPLPAHFHVQNSSLRRVPSLVSDTNTDAPEHVPQDPQSKRHRRFLMLAKDEHPRFHRMPRNTTGSE
ncbi:LRR receptor-like serine threonine-protein kinase [Musa troglodytarum]|uniref:LRR receptor-like serine threonine-protein kinase n=1 Tax=Musa troglodytarum TaxID=320322 RepID=A0A9E7FCQ7_9LILI|nr:LRR receptor-like serine threonine-protein kinase [Musa troglodytarum]